jgi:hypothetical protein
MIGRGCLVARLAGHRPDASLLYSIFSHGRSLGTTDLGFIYRPGDFRCGWLHATSLGERYLPIAAGVAPALRAEYMLGPDPTLRADVIAANDQADGLDLELRREDGVLIETSDIGIIDTEYLLSIASAAEQEDRNWELSAEDEAEIAELMAEFEEKERVASALPAEPTEWPRYQVQVYLVDPSQVP